MKRLLAIILAPAIALGAAAADFVVSPAHASMQYQAYPDSNLPALSATPAGYEPFHIEHYGRHGSRWLIDPKNYSVPVDELSKAERAGVLTPLGAEILAELRELQKASDHRLGELTPLGAEQHKGIARRMAANFPEIINDSAYIDARSTIVIRCILSMLNEVEQLQAAAPGARIVSDASEADMWYMNHHDPAKNAIVDSVREVKFKPFRQRIYDSLGNDFVGRLVSDSRFAADSIDIPELRKQLMEVALSLPSTPEFAPMAERIFTPEEINGMWKVSNASWFLNGANSALTRNRSALVQRHLLRNMIESADTTLNARRPSANLRFGHETMILSLATLLELGDYGDEYNDLENLHNEFRCYEVFPMACNVQMIFYRPADKPATKENVLVKIMLNEREMPVKFAKPVEGLYYRWSDIEPRLLEKINSVKE